MQDDEIDITLRDFISMIILDSKGDVADNITFHFHRGEGVYQAKFITIERDSNSGKIKVSLA